MEVFEDATVPKNSRLSYPFDLDQPLNESLFGSLSTVIAIIWAEPVQPVFEIQQVVLSQCSSFHLPMKLI